MNRPKEMKVCKLQVLVMPNGEVICKGVTIGLFKDLQKFLEEANADE